MYLVLPSGFFRECAGLFYLRILLPWNICGTLCNCIVVAFVSLKVQALERHFAARPVPDGYPRRYMLVGNAELLAHKEEIARVFL